MGLGGCIFGFVAVNTPPPTPPLIGAGGEAELPRKNVYKPPQPVLAAGASDCQYLDVENTIRSPKRVHKDGYRHKYPLSKLLPR